MPESRLGPFALPRQNSHIDKKKCFKSLLALAALASLGLPQWTAVWAAQQTEWRQQVVPSSVQILL